MTDENLDGLSVNYSYLHNWYIDSIDERVSPVWSEEHIEELLTDFYVIPKRGAE